uniref:Putative secreted protein n=1 Tax=Amblyomma triste TaxID=251400 RepID=A0A023G015_AMBTT
MAIFVTAVATCILLCRGMLLTAFVELVQSWAIDCSVKLAQGCAVDCLCQTVNCCQEISLLGISALSNFSTNCCGALSVIYIIY